MGILHHQENDLGSTSGAELRGAPRVGVMIRPAKLLTPEGEFLCVVRDVSETGMSARVFHEMPDCGEVMIELQNGDQYVAEIVWQAEGKIGLRFEHQADLARLVECPSQYSKRPIRVRVDVPARVSSLTGQADVSIEDISGQGAKISCEERLPLSGNITLHAAGLPETRAKIRWRRNGQYGLVFVDTLQMAELAEAVRVMQLEARNNT